MSEISKPKKNFAKSTIGALVFIAIIYMLVNVAYVKPLAPSLVLAVELVTNDAVSFAPCQWTNGYIKIWTWQPYFSKRYSVRTWLLVSCLV